MVDNVKTAPYRPLVYGLGVDANGKGGRQQLRLRNNRIAVIGDSIPANNIVNNGGVRYMAFGFMTWAAYFSRQRFRYELADNLGVAGDTSYNIVGGGPSNYPNRLAAALLINDAATWLFSFLTNDPATDIPLTASIANLQTAIATVLAAGRNVVIVPPLPRDSTLYPTTAAQRKRLAGIRNHILSLRGVPGVYVVDLWRIFANSMSATSAPKAGFTGDGLHPLQLGAWWYGYALAQFFGMGYAEGYFPFIDVMSHTTEDLYDAVENPYGSLAPNPTITGTSAVGGAGNSGNIAPGWSANAAPTNGAITYSKVTAADGTPDVQQIALGGTAYAAVADHYLLLKNPITAANLAVGKTYEGFADVEFDAGFAGYSGFGPAIVRNDTFDRYAAFDSTTDIQAYSMPPLASAGVMKTPQYPTPVGGTNIRFGILGKTVNGVAPVGNFRVKGMILRESYPW